jgi:hypothetical protein
MKGTDLFYHCIKLSFVITIGTLVLSLLLGEIPSVFQGTLFFVLWFIGLANVYHT